MRSRDGVEVLRPQFDTHCARVQAGFANAPSHLLREVRERRLQFFQVRRVLAEGMLVADRFGVASFADVAIKPAAGILAPCLPSQCEAPFPEVSSKHLLIERRKIADAADSQTLQVLLGDLP